VSRPFPARTGVAHVARVAPITPHMTRIVLAGPALDDFFVEEPGEIVTLLWSHPGQEAVLPEGAGASRRGWRMWRRCAGTCASAAA
jgi:NADPH-dependent ferric siderophore reductase